MIIKELKELTAKNVLSLLSEEQIFKHYLPSKFKFNVPFSSPFRVDKNPSFIIGDKRYRYKDFATGESGNCFNFVMNLYKINFNLALTQIVRDFNISSQFYIPNTNYQPKTEKAEFKNPGKTIYTGNVKLQIKQRDWQEYDIKYWNQHGISLSYLRLGWVFPISHYFINSIPYIAEKHAYAYVEKKDGKITYKIYQPLSNYKKWIAGGGQDNHSIWELWHLLPETGDTLIITSSRKDALAIIENLKIPAVSLQAESVMPKETVMSDILKRFKTVFLLYDNDYNKEENWGQKNAQKLSLKYPELKNIMIDEIHNSKDFSDLIKNNDKIFATKILNDLIK